MSNVIVFMCGCVFSRMCVAKSVIPMSASSSSSSLSQLVVDVLAGSGQPGVRFQEGSFETCQFVQPYNVCRWGGSLFVTDIGAHVIAEVDGAVGSGSTGIVVEGKAPAIGRGGGGGKASAPDKGHADGSAHSLSGDAYVAAVLPVLLDSIPVLPKELARLMVSYARPTGVRRIAGAKALDSSQKPADGPALNGALLSGATGIAVDLSDADGLGPALIFCDYYTRVVRSYHFRSEMVTTIAGSNPADGGSTDGPASQALFRSPFGVTVAANGVIFVAEMSGGSVRRISAPMAAAARQLRDKDLGNAPGQRTVSTAVGSAAQRKELRVALSSPLALCLRPLAVPVPTSSAGPAAEGEMDAVRLFVGCSEGVSAFDMVTGEQKHFRVESGSVTGVAVTDDGARLFIVHTHSVSCVNLATEKVTSLISGIPQFRALRVGPETPREFEYCASCVIDAQSRALIICDQNARRLIRVRGVDA
jgi:hypothetical protein